MTVPDEIWQQVFERANGYCEYCNENLLISRATYAAAQVDHVLARARGGGDTLGNLRLACSQCNSSLSRYNHLTTFEARKYLVAKKIEESHERNYQEKLSKFRKPIGESSPTPSH
jgi:5-methylcytosine-specific restriction endonuclease McrA